MNWRIGYLLAFGVAGIGLAVSEASNVAAQSQTDWRLERGTGIDLAAIDPSAKACEDFYQHACGAFIKSVELTPSRSQVSMPHEKFDASLETSLDQLFLLPSAPESELGRVKTFYQSCLADPSSSVALVKRWLRRIDKVANRQDVQEMFLALNAIGVTSFFEYSAAPDPLDTTRYVGELDEKIAWQDPAVVERTFVLAGLSKAQARSDANAVEAIVTELSDTHGASNTTNRMATLADLERMAPAIAWDRFLDLLGARAKRPLVISSKPYLAAVSRVMSTRPISQLRAYLRWSFLFSLRGELPAPYNEAFGDVTPRLRVALDQPTRKCRDATLRAMGVEFSRQYSQRIIGAEAKTLASTIADTITDEIVSSAQSADWLSDAGRQAIAYKLRQTDHKLGFPESWPEVGNFALSDKDFLANVLAARRYNVRRSWDRVNQARSRTNWDMNVYPWVGAGPAFARLVTPNGFPDLDTNSILMTAALLNRPFFDKDAAVEANYATFGYIFAHEFVHIADTHEYGAFGEQRPVLSAADLRSAKRQSQCVIDQATASPAPPGSSVSGEANYTENVADLGGVRLAYEALAKRLGTGMSKQDASGMTPARRFFYHYAQINCTAATQDTLRQLVADDSHALPSYRVNGPLSNLPAFSEAFGCKASSKMRRANTKICRVW